MFNHATKNQKAIIHVLTIAVIEFIWMFVFKGIFHHAGWLVSLENGPQKIGMLVLQTILFMIPAIAHMILSAVEHKHEFFRVYSIKVPKDRKKWIVLITGCIYITVSVVTAIIKKQHGFVLFTACYILVFVGFLEEFIFRGLMDEHMQHHDMCWLQWVFPAAMFAIVHLASPLAQGEFSTGNGFLHIMLELALYFSIGILMKLLKEKTGTMLNSIFLLSLFELIEATKFI